ncbi:MAG: hypothetical protein DYG88_03960 [Chloroflexi bacterium CFX4]|nr:hypothetical protein [Chloroflexi bacterium CFX4]MDL1921074.1 hypothetical protein [Chloroflexi bacterium CFX3]
MPINWGRLLGNALVVGAAFGAAALGVKAIQAEVERLSGDLTDENLLAVAHRAASLEDSVWVIYAQNLQLQARYNSNAQALLEMGMSVRNGMGQVAQLARQYPSPRQAAEISFGALSGMAPVERLGFTYALQYNAAHGNMHAQATMGFLQGMISG